MPRPPNKPRRHKSFVGQWDKTTKVVNVKQKYYVNEADRYTDVQKATFTRWVNIQLRSIHQYDFLNSDCDDNRESLASRLPEIKAIDKDFRDGTRLIELLEVLYEDDPELPKRERSGNTRHHHIANVNKVLDFLKNRLDESGLAALQAIGPVDIVDGNVKLTLGLIWLIISRFHQMVSVFEEVVTEEELAAAKAQSRLLNGEADDVDDDGYGKKHIKNLNPNLWFNLDIESIESQIDELESIINDNNNNNNNNNNRNKQNIVVNDDDTEDVKIEVTEINEPSIILEEDEEKSDYNNDANNNHLRVNNNINKNNSIRYSRMFLDPRQNANIISNYNKRMSLPAAACKEFQLPPKRFRTLRPNNSSTPISSSSGLLFWLNMQLIDYASMLPSSSYPIEDFTGLNDGVLLSALIHHKNMEWFEDFDLLIKDLNNKNKSGTATESLDEIKAAATKERLQKCFKVLEEKLDVKPPKALVSMLIEDDKIHHQLNEEQFKGKTGIAWSVYISEIFIAMSNKGRKKQKKDQARLSIITQKQQEQRQKQHEQVDGSDNNVLREISESSTAVDMISPQSTLFDEEGDIEEGYSPYSTSKGASPACSPLSPLPPWSPKKLLVSAVWDWAIRWIVGDDIYDDGDYYYDEDDDEDDDDYDDYDDYDNYYEDEDDDDEIDDDRDYGNRNENENDSINYARCKMKTIKITNGGHNNNNGSWDIRNVDEWKRNYKRLGNNKNSSNNNNKGKNNGNSPLELLTNVHQSNLCTN